MSTNDAPKTHNKKIGVKIHRRFTKLGESPFNTVQWDKRTSRIRDESGRSIFEKTDAEVPMGWSQVATDIIVSKYFRRAGVPQVDEQGKPIIGADGKQILGSENSAKQVIKRITNCWRFWGEKYGFFASPDDAKAFEEELQYTLIHQMTAPNSPQWFNTGLALSYGIKGPGQGHFYVDPDDGVLKESDDAYSRPQTSACFIQSVKDSLLEEGGIMDLVMREARVFKYGSGTGTNFSNIREEGAKLSGGGNSSGLMSWLRIFDRAAGAIKSGGTTRRAAKMVILNVDHPDIEQFVWWKANEEKKVAALVAAGYPSDFNGEAYQTVSGQNSNNTVRVSNDFLEAVEKDGEWGLVSRVPGRGIVKSLKARKLWQDISQAAWQSADPGLQYDTTIQEWHTCPNSGRINATNPCCITGDTLIAVADGKNAVPIKELAGKETPVYTWDLAKKQVVIGKMHNIGIKREKAEIFRVTLDDGSSFRATDDHLIMLKDGAYRQVKDLQPGDSLMPFHSTSNNDPDLQITQRFVSVVPEEREDVYDGTVDDHHNFGIITSHVPFSKKADNFSGIFIHNSEYVFLDDTACNLASINLAKFVNEETRQFDVDSYLHTIRLWTMVLEISVLMSQFPSDSIAANTYRFRTLGLGYANLGTLLMLWGIPYNSAKARAIAGALTATLTGEAYATSAMMAEIFGPFAEFQKNREPMLRVMRNHRRAAYAEADEQYENLTVKPVAIDPNICPQDLLTAARSSWDKAVELGEKYGYRNAQVSVLAPTGCLVGNSIVSTNKGLMRLEKLGNPTGEKWQNINLNVYTNDGTKQANKFFINGIAETRRIHTSAGYEIQGTLKHKIRVVDQESGEWIWKQFDAITKGDVIPLAMHTVFGNPREIILPPLGESYWAGNENGRAPKKMSAELAELLGYFMGDGSLHAKGLRFCVSNEDHDVTERLSTLIRSLFNVEPHLSAKKGYQEVALNSVPVVEWWGACGFAKLLPNKEHKGKGYTPYLPDALLATNDQNIYRAFLRGLFEADGSVTSGNPTWTTACESFSSEIKTLLLALGFPTTTKLDISGWGKSTLYVLRIKNKSYNAAFLDEISFIGARKKEKISVAGIVGGIATWQTRKRDYVYLPQEVVTSACASGSGQTRRAVVQMEIRRHGAISRNLAQELFLQTKNPIIARALNYFFDTVSTNEDGGEQPTYDLSVPENVTYTANGFLSHNTIGLLMDCDTTGIEPDFALVKFKKLAGGGYFKIVNQSVPGALRSLGYTAEQIQEIVRYVTGTLSFTRAPHINHPALLEKGFSDEDIQRLEKLLPSVFSLEMAFSTGALGEALLAKLDLTEKAKDNPMLDVLRELGFTEEQVRIANEEICGRMTIEGAPHLKPEHYEVFDCANKCGPKGTRYIASDGHIHMLASVQPFVSGSISKTVNMPNEATVEDIENAYLIGWKLGLKCNALYRDGSKLSQPLSTKSKEKEKKDEKGEPHSAEASRGEPCERIIEKIVEKVVERPHRVKLPNERQAITRKVNLAGQEFYVTVGMYSDGKPGEVFITMSQEGTFASGMADAFAKILSIALQYGVPLPNVIRQLRHMRFAPDGFTGSADIPTASSVVDFLAQWLNKTFPDGNWKQTGQLPLPDTEAKVEISNTQLPISNDGGRNKESHSKETRSADNKTNVSSFGFTGDRCPNCGSMRMVQNGTCKKCMDCGETTGCS